MFSERSITQWKEQDKPSKKLIITYHFREFFLSTQSNVLNAFFTHPITQNWPRYLSSKSMLLCNHTVPMLHNLYHIPSFKTKTTNIIQIPKLLCIINNKLITTSKLPLRNLFMNNKMIDNFRHHEFGWRSSCPNNNPKNFPSIIFCYMWSQSLLVIWDLKRHRCCCCNFFCIVFIGFCFLFSMLGFFFVVGESYILVWRLCTFEEGCYLIRYVYMDNEGCRLIWYHMT